MRLHLVYHITAVDRPLMWYNLSRLKDKLPLFNGTKVITIAVPGNDNATKLLLNYKTHEELEEAVSQAPYIVKHIQKFLADTSIIYNIVPNALEEGTKHFFTLAAPMVETTAPDDFTFYGHTKGIRYLPGTGEYFAASVWTDVLYSTVLDNFLDAIGKLNSGYSAYGAMKVDTDASWSYEGAFFWFRNWDVFRQPNWNITENFNLYRMEDFLPRVIDTAHAYSAFDLPETFQHRAQLLSYGAWELYFQSQGKTMYEVIDEMNVKVQTIVIPADA